MDVKGTVHKLINAYKTNNPFQLAELKNIEISYEPLGNIMGYYNSYKRIKFIHINCDLDDRIQRFVCAHELGHAVLHPKANTPFLQKNTFYSTEKIEKEANTFAVELLMTDEELYEHQDTSMTIYEAAEMYGVPKELAHLKGVRRGH